LSELPDGGSVFDCFRVKMPPDGFSGLARHNGRERLSGGLLHIAQASEMGEQALASLGAYAGYIQKL
jgi:hypothetical protein